MNTAASVYEWLAKLGSAAVAYLILKETFSMVKWLSNGKKRKYDDTNGSNSDTLVAVKALVNGKYDEMIRINREHNTCLRQLIEGQTKIIESNRGHNENSKERHTSLCGSIASLSNNITQLVAVMRSN